MNVEYQNFSPVFIMGLSGAGKTCALNALENIGYTILDNLPAALIPNLPYSILGSMPLAISLNISSGYKILNLLSSQRPFYKHFHPLLIFLDCSNRELYRRFSATRHAHPLEKGFLLERAIKLEREKLYPIRHHADKIIDTTDMSPSRLSDLVQMYARAHKDPFIVQLCSFSYRKGVLQESDIVFDVRFLSNPHYVPTLRPLTGLNESVASYIRQDAFFDLFIKKANKMIVSTIDYFRSHGKHAMIIGIGCTGGRHRSVFVTTVFSDYLQSHGVKNHCVHMNIATV